MADRETIKKFRQTAAGVKLGKIIFNPTTQGQISPAQITSLLRQAGLPIPKEVEVGVGVAQVLMAGGAFVQAAQTAQTIGQIAKPTLSLVQAAFTVLQLVGIIDADEVSVRAIALGITTAAVISSGGMNIIADIALLVQLSIEVMFPSDERPKVRQELQKLTYENGKRWWLDRVSTQYQARMKLTKDYIDKKISCFEFVGEMALQSPDTFSNYFPEYKAFIPPYLFHACFTSWKDANHGGFLMFGRETETVVESFCFDFETVAVSRQFMQEVFLRKYITDPFSPYWLLSKMPKSQLLKYGFPPDTKGLSYHANPVSRIPFSSLAVLSMASKSFDFVGNDFDVVPVLEQLGVTPYDLDPMNDLFTGVSTTDFIPARPVVGAAVTVNGLALYNEAQKKEQAQRNLDNYTISLMDKYNREGNITELAKIPAARAIMKEWGTIPYLSQDQVAKYAAAGTLGFMQGKNGKYNNQEWKPYTLVDPSLVVNYRNISNYFSALSMLDVFMKDKFFQDATGRDSLTQVQAMFAQKKAVEDLYQQTVMMYVAKMLNVGAKANIASFYNAPIEDMDFKIKDNGLGYVVPKK